MLVMYCIIKGVNYNIHCVFLLLNKKVFSDAIPIAYTVHDSIPITYSHTESKHISIEYLLLLQVAVSRLGKSDGSFSKITVYTILNIQR